MPNDDYMSAKAWPFEQARALLKRLDIEKKRGIDRGGRPVTFETGYGPSGLPHIGTFGEVVRTTMVRNAFVALTEGKVPTKLICCLLYTSPSPRDRTRSRMPSSA